MQVVKDSKLIVDSSIFGGKNYWTSVLIKNGFNVPKSIYYPAGTYKEYKKYVETAEFLNSFQSSFNTDSILCIRSSALLEDKDSESGAGKYKSVIGVRTKELKDAFLKVVSSGRSQSEKVGVLLQEMINPEYSGVIFSSNPLTKYRDEVVIEYVEGFGEKLMSGEKKGSSLIVDINNLSSLNGVEIREPLLELITSVKKLEKLLSIPVDVEWCIEKDTHKLFIVQCRPITNILYANNCFAKIDETIIRYPDIKDNEKVFLRLVGLKNNIYVSPAYIIRCNCLEDDFPDLNIDFNPTDLTSGYSVVVISPRVIKGEVMRSFAGINKQHNFKCNRYGVRLSPGSYKELKNCIKEMYHKLKTLVWSFTIIIQEVFDPFMTGIVKQSNNGFVMEILRGHFAAKGIFHMTKYAINKEFDIIYKDEVYQDNYYLIVEGNKVLIPNEEKDKKVKLHDSLIIDIFKKVAPLFVVKGLNVEFGILKNDDKYLPYLIDYTIESEEYVDFDNISNGIISSGKVTGKLIKVDSSDPIEAIDTHFYNKVQKKSAKTNNVIYVCELPTISLLKLLEESGDNIGFVFKEGSSLCHFAVTLRERNIPAIVGVDINSLDYHRSYTLDTNKKGTVDDKIY